MVTATFQVQIGDEAARQLAASSAGKREMLNRLISRLVEQYAGSTPASLLERMDALSRNAHARGLTEENLDSILSDE
jgi:hypothetical protein